MLESWWMRHFSDDQTQDWTMRNVDWHLKLKCDDRIEWNPSVNKTGHDHGDQSRKKRGEKLYKSCLVYYLLIYFEGTNQRGGGREGRRRRRRRRGRYCHDSRDVITRTYPFEYCGTDECDLWLHTLIVLGELGGDTEAAAARGHQFENWEKGIKIGTYQSSGNVIAMQVFVFVFFAAGHCWIIDVRCYTRAHSLNAAAAQKNVNTVVKWWTVATDGAVLHSSRWMCVSTWLDDGEWIETFLACYSIN